ncbi:MAG: insulinase family protein [Spirochaetaceae bacterium]|nr:insulinase family protein [Spirochaetaceae bacterium]
MKNRTLRRVFRPCRGAFYFLAILFFLAQAPLFGRGVREPDYSPASGIPRDSKVITGELDGGIRYYIRRNVRPENRAELRLAVNAGSVLEDEDQRGLAHLVEHMAFQGTRNFARHELVGWLESIGMRFGPETNAYTSFDETVYQLTVPTDDPRLMDTALSILEDWLEGLTIDSDALKKERGVVLEEWRLGRGVNSRVRDVQIPVLLSGSRYAERLPIGKPEVITGSPDDSVRRFYRDWYRPDLAAIIAVGDFDPNEMERRIHERFSRPNAAPGRQREKYPVPAHGETLVSCVSDPELGQTSVGVYTKREAKTPRTIAEYRERIAESLFFSIMNERLDEAAKRPDAPFLTAGMGASRFARPVRAAYLAATVEDAWAAEGLAALVREVKRAALHGFSRAELERAKAVYLRSFEQTWREAENTASSSLVSLYVNNYLEDRPMLGPEYAHGLAQRYVPGITEDEITAFAKIFLEEENRVVLVTGPSSGRLLAEEEVLDVLRKAAAEDPEALAEEATPEALLEILPSPGAARRVQSSQAEAAGFTEWKLENGMRVVLKTTDFKNDELLVTAFSRGGTSRAADEDYLSADFAENVAQESGVGQFSLMQLQKFLSGKRVTLTPRIYGQTEGFQGSSSVKDAQTLFQLIAAYFTSPRLDREALGAFFRQVKSSLREEEKQPDTIFFNKVREVLTQNHLRNRPVTPDMIDAIDVDKAFAFYKDRFANAAGFTFIFVGSLSAQDMEPYLETYLAGLPSLGREENHVDTGQRLFRGKKQETVRAGREERSIAALLFTGDFTWTREEAFALRTLEDYLDLRLREVLREDKGGTYGVSVQASAYRHPVGEYSIGIYFGASPEAAAELTQTALAAIEEMKATLPREEDAAKIREQALRAHERLLRENSFWIERLRFELYHELAADVDAWRSREIKAITPQRIQELLRKYCNPENLARVLLLPGEEAED